MQPIIKNTYFTNLKEERQVRHNQHVATMYWLCPKISDMDNEKNFIPIWEQYTLSIEEAAIYFGIDEKKYTN